MRRERQRHVTSHAVRRGFGTWSLSLLHQATSSPTVSAKSCADSTTFCRLPRFTGTKAASGAMPICGAHAGRVAANPSRSRKSSPINLRTYDVRKVLQLHFFVKNGSPISKLTLRNPISLRIALQILSPRYLLQFALVCPSASSRWSWRPFNRYPSCIVASQSAESSSCVAGFFHRANFLARNAMSAHVWLLWNRCVG